MAENAEMQALKRIDNSGMKQYDMKKGPPQAMFGIDMGMKKTMKAEAEQAEMMAMKAAYEDGYKGLARAGIDYPSSPGYPSSRDRLPTMRLALPSDAWAAKMEAEEAVNKAAMKAAMKAAKMQAEEAGNKAAMKAAKMQAEQAGNKAAMQAAEAAEYAEHQRKQNAAIEVFRFERREAAMKAAKMQAEEAAMKAAKMQVVDMQVVEAVEKAAMRVEGYEMMQPWGSMVY